MSFLLEIYKAAKNILAQEKFFLSFIILSFVFFGIMFSIPVYSIPGNSFKFQSVLFKTQDYILLVAMALLSSLSIVIQVGSMVNDKKRDASALLSGAGIFSTVVSSIFSSATCGMCVGALFSFLGFGTILFLVNNRWYILAGALILLLLSLYISARKYNRGCEVCLIIPSPTNLFR